jgi:hypothetical protein
VVPLVSALSLATHHDWYSFIVLVQVLIPWQWWPRLVSCPVLGHFNLLLSSISRKSEKLFCSDIKQEFAKNKRFQLLVEHLTFVSA